MALEDSCVDVIWTDPPYQDDVAYHDLSAPLRAWARLGSVDRRESVVSSVGQTSRYERLLRSIFIECRRVLKPRGRLLLTFANREPGAWIALFRALREAELFAQGYEIVVSDATLDHAKRSPSSASMDIILDLSTCEDNSRVHRPRAKRRRGQARFLATAGEAFLRVVSRDPPDGWESALRPALTRRLRW
jgi:hypothetical protein